MIRHFFTFGVTQPYRKHYVEIIAPDPVTARNMMFRAHGKAWLMEYDEVHFKGQPEAYGLTKLATFDFNDQNVDWQSCLHHPKEEAAESDS